MTQSATSAVGPSDGWREGRDERRDECGKDSCRGPETHACRREDQAETKLKSKLNMSEQMLSALSVTSSSHFLHKNTMRGAVSRTMELSNHQTGSSANLLENSPQYFLELRGEMCQFSQ